MCLINLLVLVIEYDLHTLTWYNKMWCEIIEIKMKLNDLEFSVKYVQIGEQKISIRKEIESSIYWILDLNSDLY